MDTASAHSVTQEEGQQGRQRQYQSSQEAKLLNILVTTAMITNVYDSSRTIDSFMPHLWRKAH